MATFSKQFNKAIPAGQRHQVVDSTELSTGDIIDVPGVLGGSPSRKVYVTTDGSANLQVRFNVLTKVYPKRGAADGFGTAADLPYDHIGNEVELIDGSVSLVDVAVSQTRVLLHEGPLKSIEVTWSTGTWSLEFLD